jgi:hypothetical protein
LRELHALGLLESDPALLEQFGFSQVYVAEGELRTRSPSKRPGAAARILRRARQHRHAAVLRHVRRSLSRRAEAPSTQSSHISSTRRFEYPATRLQYDLDLECASTFALDQLACTSLFSAVRVARCARRTGDARRVLCVSSEFFPVDAGREAIYNCTGRLRRARCSSTTAPIVIAFSRRRTRPKGYYWQGDAMRNEIVASYFPTAKARDRGDAQTREVAPRTTSPGSFPHNISIRSWEILLGLTGIPRERLWCRNIARIGHTLAGDNFINLRDAVSDGSVRPGDRLLLFSYGYGAHWTALALDGMTMSADHSFSSPAPRACSAATC